MPEMFVPKRAEKFFIYYHPDTEEIQGVSAHMHDEFKDSACMSVPYEIGERFITGKLSINGYRIQQNQESSKASLHPIQMNTKIVRLISEGFIHIEHVNPRARNAEIILRYQKGSSKLRIEATPALYKRLDVQDGQPIHRSGASHGVFYISKWNDPSFYANALRVSMDRLLARRVLEVDLGFPVQRSLSIFTKKIFDTYAIKEIRKNVT